MEVLLQSFLISTKILQTKRTYFDFCCKRRLGLRPDRLFLFKICITKTMFTFINKLTIQYLKKKISEKEYSLERLNEMNGQIQFWKRSQQNAKTITGRNYCNLMVNMYLKRYQFYLNK